MAWWIWVIIGVVLLTLEFASATLHLGVFAVGAFVVAILVALGVDMPLWGQLVTFTATTIFSFLFVRPVIVRKLRLHESKTVDSLVGEHAVALDEIGPAALGKAEMRGTTWSARNVGETVLLRGQRCVVAAVEGLVIHVRAS
jgi:inner membrane protein